MNIKKLFWWKYQPVDEREQVLYSNAYKQSLNVLASAVSVIAWLLLAEPWTFLLSTYPWMKFLFYPRALGLILFVVVFAAYFIGTRSLRHEELQLKLPLKSAVNNGFAMFIMFILLTTLFGFFGGGSLIGEWPF